ncbi:MAG: TetR/AcrR family transcriptional regulator [Blautia sp.]|nr:TetR/AcrR family transcriptional regulator [Blautia sp.]MCM1199810.1 TetR/AcrR family transcriptional regulator [Bacteroides fragilis]
MSKVKGNAEAGCQPKVKAIYRAVFELLEEGADLNSLTVSEITKKAGIGKGTAYEYFSDKEEMIAKAIFYNVEMFCERICDGVDREKSLYDKADFVLRTMEQQISHANCLFRFVHIISGSSAANRRLCEVLEQQKQASKKPVAQIAGQILEGSFRSQERLSEEKRNYLVMSVCSKMLCYGMLLNEEQYCRTEKREAMRRLICRGICREVEEIDVL